MSFSFSLRTNINNAKLQRIQKNSIKFFLCNATALINLNINEPNRIQIIARDKIESSDLKKRKRDDIYKNKNRAGKARRKSAKPKISSGICK